MIGNLAVDRVDDNPPSPGGCPSFVAAAIEHAGVPGRIITKRAHADAHVFTEMLGRMSVPVTILDAETTSAFGLRYEGERRTMNVDAIGDAWTAEDLATAGITTTWVHVAPLLRGECSDQPLGRLAASGHRLSYDGQGLVRIPRTGAMGVDRDYDHGLLSRLSVLKLADDEADVVAGGLFDEAVALRLGVPEIIVTSGSDGSDVYVTGRRTHVPAAFRVLGVETTGAGDMFIVAYVARRSSGTPPVDAAHAASELVAEVLERRRKGAAG